MTRRLRSSRRTVLVAALTSSLAMAAVGLGAGARANPGDPPGTIRTIAGSFQNFTQGCAWTAATTCGDGKPATQAQLYDPRAMALDGKGGFYIADALSNVVRHVDANGVINIFAGNGTASATATAANGDGGPATSATLNQPHGLAVDSVGNVYISDSQDEKIREVDIATGTISTIAGSGVLPPPKDADSLPAKQANLKVPKSLFMGPGDKLYICDSDNNEIRMIDGLNTPSPMIHRIAGQHVSRHYDGDNGPATQHSLFKPEGLWVDAGGTIYVADTGNDLIRTITPDGQLHTIAGDVNAASAHALDAVPITPDAGDGGQALSAVFNVPRGLAVDSAGNIYVGEDNGEVIRRINPAGIVSTIAGDGTAQSSKQVKGDPGPAPALQAEFNTIHQLTLGPDGDLWVADSKDCLVRAISDPADAPARDASTGGGGNPGGTGGGGNPGGSGGGGGGNLTPAPSGQSGYWMLGSDGKVYGFGDAHPMGDASSLLPPGATATHIEPTPDFGGYWIVDDAGHVFAFGDAKPLGNAPGLSAGERVTSLSTTPSGAGYWLFTTAGRVFPFGDAQSFGDMSHVHLNGAIRSSIPTPTGKGYFMVGSDGGVFAFGDAVFHGSMGATRLNQPVESLVPTRDNGGYWLVASDGGIFAFGDAPFKGSMGATHLNKPVVGMVRYGDGYLMVGADGGIFDFSNKPFVGSLGANPPAHPIVFAATLDT